MKTGGLAAALGPLLGLALGALALAGCGDGSSGVASADVVADGAPSMSPEGSADGDAAPSEPATGGGEVPSGNGTAGDDAGMTPVGEGTPPSVAGGTGDSAEVMLETRVVTLYADEDNHESWVCVGEGGTAEYRVRIDADGTRRGRASEPADAEPVPFRWAALGADRLLFDFRELGTQLEIGSIRFGGLDAFVADSSATGNIECRRQRYVDGEPTRDVSADVPVDVDGAAEAALVLTERIATRYAGAEDFDAWRCTSAGEEPERYLFTAADTFAPEPRALVLRERQPLAEARVFRWAASDGATLLLTRPDLFVGELLVLHAIVFPVEDAFTATLGDATLQCLLTSGRTS